MREEAEEERSLLIARRDDGLGDGQHGSGQNLQAEALGAEPSGGLDRDTGGSRVVSLSPWNVQREREDLVLGPGG